MADLSRSDDLDHSIAKLHMMQFSEEYRDVLDTYMAARTEEIARELLYSFENLDYKLTPPYTLAFYSEDGGHAVTPIRAEVIGSGYRILSTIATGPKRHGGWILTAADGTTRHRRWIKNPRMDYGRGRERALCR